MVTRAGLRGYVETLRVQASALTADAARAAMVITAERARDRVLAGTPKPSGYRQIVDGIEGAPLTAVRPDGVIVFAWQYLGFVVRDTFDALVARSPNRSGAYIAGIKVSVDGRWTDPDEIPAGTLSATIVATVPYARRLEVGRDSAGGPFVRQVAPHIVEETAITARALWGSLASFNFRYVDLAEAHALTAAGRVRWHFRNGRAVRGSRRTDTVVRYPAIEVRARVA